MGVGTIMDARRVILMAYGEHKAPIVKKAVEGEINLHISASYLQQHSNCTFVLDPASASELTRFKTPWLLGPIEQFGLAWDLKTTKKAVIWLAGVVGKPILKLTDEDYNENGLQDLLSCRGRAYDTNIEVFKAMQGTITGWPGGKAGGRGPHGGSDAFPKRVVVFSPHPDDDVISMGGTFIRLCEQGHDVHVAYQTSGNIAVWDESADRHVDFVEEFCKAFGVGAATSKGGGEWHRRRDPAVPQDEVGRGRGHSRTADGEGADPADRGPSRREVLWREARQHPLPRPAVL
jgi:glucosamine-6-phosphate deaminase